MGPPDIVNIPRSSKVDINEDSWLTRLFPMAHGVSMAMRTIGSVKRFSCDLFRDSGPCRRNIKSTCAKSKNSFLSLSVLLPRLTMVT